MIRSSMSLRINALGDVGGVNSINNFARSWQRAAGFFEITPSRSSFRIASDDETGQFPREGLPGPQDHQSLLRAALENEGRRLLDNVFDEENGVSEETSL